MMLLPEDALVEAVTLPLKRGDSAESSDTFPGSFTYRVNVLYNLNVYKVSKSNIIVCKLNPNPYFRTLPSENCFQVKHR